MNHHFILLLIILVSYNGLIIQTNAISQSSTTTLTATRTPSHTPTPSRTPSQTPTTSRTPSISMTSSPTCIPYPTATFELVDTIAELYTPGGGEGFSVPNKLLHNSLIIGSIESNVYDYGFLYGERNPNSDVFSSSIINVPGPYYDYVNIYGLDACNEDIVVAVRPDDPYYPTLQRMYTYKDLSGAITFNSELSVPSMCTIFRFGAVHDGRNNFAVKMGSNLLSTICRNGTSATDYIAFFRKNYLESWIEHPFYTTVTVDTTNDNAGVFIRNDARIVVINEPAIQTVRIYSHDVCDGMTLLSTITDADIPGGGVRFGASVVCRHTFVDRGQLEPSYVNMCIICDDEISYTIGMTYFSEIGRCYIFTDIDTGTPVLSPNYIEPPLTPNTPVHFGGSGTTFVDTVDVFRLFIAETNNPAYVGTGPELLETIYMFEFSLTPDPTFTNIASLDPSSSGLSEARSISGSYDSQESYLTVSLSNSDTAIGTPQLNVYCVATERCCGHCGSGGDISMSVDTCTYSTCTSSGAVFASTKVCSDTYSCTADSCDSKFGCQYDIVTLDTPCEDDGDPCTLDSCSEFGCCLHTVASCSPTPSISQSNTPSITPTPTPSTSFSSTPTPTSTLTLSATQTPSTTVSATPSTTMTGSNSPTPTTTMTLSATPTPTPTSTLTLSATPTPSTTPSASETPTVTPTNTLTATNTPTPSNTPTSSNTPTPSTTPSASETPTISQTPTQTPTGTSSQTPTQTPTGTPTSTVTPTNTGTPSNSATPTFTPTASVTPGESASNTPTISETPTSSATSTATESQTPTATPTGTMTSTGTPTQTPSNSPTPSTTSTQTITATPTPTSTLTLSATNTPTPSNTPTVTPTRTSSQTRTPSNTPTPTRTPSRTPSTTSTSSLSSTGTPTPTTTRSASSTPTPSITPSPSNTPSNTRTPSNTPTPTRTPSDTPSISLTPTISLSNTPSNTPTRSPTQTQTPTSTGTRTSSKTPTGTASVTPSSSPTTTPSASVSNTPTPSVTETPTMTQTPTSTITETQTPTTTPSVSETPTASTTPSASMTPTTTISVGASASNTPSISETPTVTPTQTPTSSISETPTTTMTATPTQTATSSVTPTPTTTVSASNSPTPSTTLSLSSTQSMSASFTSTPSLSSSVSPTPSTTPVCVTPTPCPINACGICDTDCRIVTDPYQCSILDNVFGTTCNPGCGIFGECNGFGECMSLTCNVTDDTCVGMDCSESRARAFRALSAQMMTIDMHLNMFGVSGNTVVLESLVSTVINYINETKTVAEWVQEIETLIHRHKGACYNESCDYWVNTMYPDLNHAFLIMSELIARLGIFDAHGIGINDIDCFPDNGHLFGLATFEDLLYENEFIDNDVNDIISPFRYCIYSQFYTNVTISQSLEAHVIAKGSWFDHKLQLTLNGSFSHLYPQITYQHPEKLLDTSSTTITRVYNQDRSPSAYGWIDNNNVITAINSTAAITQDQTILQPTKSERIINTGLAAPRCPKFYTRTIIYPDTNVTRSNKQLDVPPLYFASSISTNRTSVCVLPSENVTLPALNQNDFSISFLDIPTGYVLNNTCYFFPFERNDITSSHPNIINYIMYLENGGVCNIIGCQDWYYSFIPSKVYSLSLDLDKYGTCF